MEITVHNQTEQDAEYQVTPAPPPFPEDAIQWLPLPAGETRKHEAELPVLVQFRIVGGLVPYYPAVMLNPSTPELLTATLSQLGGFFVVVVS